tara:strand:+ start:1256 stop:1978 length:723 start_codon:yes stop_codon:yes gene_type:complete
MFGPHAIAENTRVDQRLLENSTAQIVKDFIRNEEGILSSNYVGILKKYYTAEMAEKLFILHCLAIKSGIVSRAYTRNEDGVMQVDSRSLEYQLTSSHQVKRYITLYVGEHDSTNAYLIKRSLERLFGSSISYSLNNQSLYRECQYMDSSAGVSIDHDGLFYCVGLPERSYLKCFHDKAHKEAIVRFGNAATLQRFFHEGDVGGYNATSVLKSLYDSMDLSREQQTSDAADAGDEAFGQNM